MRKLFVLLAAISLSACIHTEQKWVRSYDGNQLEISSGSIGDAKDNNKFVNIANTNRIWEGTYKGGEPMVPARKQLLLSVAQGEAKQVCKPSDYTADGEPSYSMMDRSPEVFGGGLLGYAIAAAASDYENLPTSVNYRFKCTGFNPKAANTPAVAPDPIMPAGIMQTPTAK